MTSPMASSKKAPFFFFQPKANVNTEIDKLVERLGILPELDMTRLRLVVYEMGFASTVDFAQHPAICWRHSVDDYLDL